MTDASITIGQIAKRAGIRPSKIRYYESVGLLSAARRASGRRMYDDSALDTLQLIQFSQDAGFSIDEIRHVLAGFDRRTPPSARWQRVAQEKLVDVRSLIERARRMEQVLEALLSCSCVRLSDCVDRCQPAEVHLQRRGARERATP